MAVRDSVELHGGLVAGDGASLKILGRTEWLTRNRVPELCRSRLLLPRGALRTIDINPHPRFEDVSAVDLGAAEARIGVTVPSDSDVHLLLADAPARMWAVAWALPSGHASGETRRRRGGLGRVKARGTSAQSV